MTTVDVAGELLVGTREQVQAEMVHAVRAAAAAGRLVRFSAPAPWPGSPGVMFVRVRHAEPAGRRRVRYGPPPGRRNLGALVAVVLFVVVWLFAGGVVIALTLTH